MNFITRRFKNITVAQKLYFAVGIMTFLLLVELFTLWFTIHSLSAVRGYVGAEGLWSKAQKDASYHLYKYSVEKKETDYKAFLDHLKVNLGDRKTRIELLNKNPDYELAKQGFIEGRVHENDIPDMIDLFRRFNKIYYIDQAIHYWTQGDSLIAELVKAGAALHTDILSNKSTLDERIILRTKINELNKELTHVEDNFSSVLGDGARWLENLVLTILLLTAGFVELSGLFLSISISRGVSKTSKELAFQNKEKEKRAEELAVAYNVLGFQIEEKEKRAAELGIANKELGLQNEEKEKRIAERKQDEEYIGHLAAIVESSDDAIISQSLDGTIKSWNKGAEKMFGFTSHQAVGKPISLIIPPTLIDEEKKIFERILNNEIIQHFETVRNKKSGEQFYVSLTISPLKDPSGNIIGVSKIARDITSYKKSEAEITQKTEDLIQANQELASQNELKEKRAAELIIANKELAYQNDEKEKRAAELSIANKELAFQNKEKEKRAEELSIANKELAFQNDEKEKRAAELIIANEELAFQNDEKEKRAEELSIANKELAYQNDEKEKRAEELSVANKELAYQNEEKEKRAAELIIANEELAYQNEEKEKRAAELIIANKELAYQNEEKEKRAAELIIANKELAFQNEEKEKRAAKLFVANKELEQFAYVASHDLQEPLRTISNFVGLIGKKYSGKLDTSADQYLSFIVNATTKMQTLIKDLLDYSRIGRNLTFSPVDCNEVLKEVIGEMGASIEESNAKITISDLPVLKANFIELKQLFQNLISNAIKFRKKDVQLEIDISVDERDAEYLFAVKDNGIGIDESHIDKLFVIFQRLHNATEYPGTGIGLANCKKIVMLYGGKIWIESKVGEGSIFYFTFPKEKLIENQPIMASIGNAT